MCFLLNAAPVHKIPVVSFFLQLTYFEGSAENPKKRSLQS
ncbi:hypothetical protein C4K40_3139 [Pseudomonas sp. CMR5c]|nr:hypothetical protein C4K40_3139 [Pseudomonas sp. CMR5c]